MIAEGTVFSHTHKWRGKPTVTECKWESGKWWKQDRRGSWKACVTTETNRINAAYLASSQLSLIPASEGVETEIPGHLQKYFQKFEDAYLEMKASQNAERKPEYEALHDDITNDSIIEPVMYREDILGPKPKYRTLQRHHVGDSRYYVQQFQQADGTWTRPQLYAGVTSVVGAVLPENDFLKKWWCSFPTYEDAERELNRLAAKGTIMHTLFAMCMRDDKTYRLPEFGTSEFDRLLRRLISDQDIPVHEVFGEWKAFFCKAILGFKQFCYDSNVEPLAVEIVLGQPHQYFEDGSKPCYGYFAQLDLLCFLDVMVDGFDEVDTYKSGPRKGQRREVKVPKRVLAIVDFKSGSGDYEEHDMQLLLQIPLVKAAFPNLDTSNIHIFNWHPKDFRTSSLEKKSKKEDTELEFGYSLLEKETGDYNRIWANDHLWMWRKYHASELPAKMVFQGDPNIGTKPSENVRFVDYQTFWEEKVARAIEHKFADL